MKNDAIFAYFLKVAIFCQLMVFCWILITSFKKPHSF